MLSKNVLTLQVNFVFWYSLKNIILISPKQSLKKTLFTCNLSVSVSIHVYQSSDNIRNRKNSMKMQHSSSILCVM